MSRIRLVPPRFKLERFFAAHEFSAKYLLSCSDAEAVSMAQLLDVADEECTMMWKELKLGYTESQGMPLLRREVAANLYPNCTEDDVIVGAPQELIYMAMRCMVSPGDHVVVPLPAYQSLYANLQSIGCVLHFWRPVCGADDDGFRWHFDLGDLESLVTDQIRLVVVNFPHNPTGATPTPEEWCQIIDLCRRRDVYLFSDEMYKYLDNDEVGIDESSFVWESAKLPSAGDVYEKAVSLFGVSKSLSLPGLRIGWLVTRDFDLRRRLSEFKDYLSICSSAPSEVLALIGVRNMKRLLRDNRDLIEGNLDELDGFFRRYSHCFSFFRPSASTTTYVEMKKPLIEVFRTATAFADELLHDRGVMILPSSMYWEFDRDDGRDMDDEDVYFRLGFARKNLPEILPILDRFLMDKGFSPKSIDDHD